MISMITKYSGFVKSTLCLGSIISAVRAINESRSNLELCLILGTSAYVVGSKFKKVLSNILLAKLFTSVGEAKQVSAMGMTLDVYNVFLSLFAIISSKNVAQNSTGSILSFA
jgi:hypothetical protein